MAEKSIDLNSVRQRLSTARGAEYWRCVEEFAGTEDFNELLRRDFPRHASAWLESSDRRSFLKLMGASLALAGLSGCLSSSPAPPDEKIVPYVKQPEELIPGIPKFFATTMPFPTGAIPLVVRSNEFRPTKIEGNSQHPASHGATDVFAQASLLDLYDPDRSQASSYRGEHRNWADFHTAIDQYKLKAAASGGAGLRFLSETVTSPTLASQIQAMLKKFLKAYRTQLTKDRVSDLRQERESWSAFCQALFASAEFRYLD